MANYWTEYSFVIDNLTNEQIKWWKDKVKKLDELDETEGYYLEDVDEDGYPKDSILTRYYYEDYGNPNSSFVIDELDNYVWCTSSNNEGGNIDGMIEVIQDYLEEMEPSRIVAYEWIQTCSNPRLDAYHGGAVAISKDETIGECTIDAVPKLVNVLKAKLNKGVNNDSQSN
jgi:hypothetical protein